MLKISNLNLSLNLSLQHALEHRYNETNKELVFSKVRYSEEAALRVSELPDLILAKSNRKVRYYEVTVPTTPAEKMSELICEEEIDDDDMSMTSNSSTVGCLSVAMASPKFALTSLPGYGDPTKYAVSYDGDNGMKYLSTLQALSKMDRETWNAGAEFKFGPAFGRPGDVIGAGIIFDQESEEDEGPGHKKKRFCPNCGYTGHALRKCFFTKRCFACGSRGHRKSECTWNRPSENVTHTHAHLEHFYKTTTAQVRKDLACDVRNVMREVIMLQSCVRS